MAYFPIDLQEAPSVLCSHCRYVEWIKQSGCCRTWLQWLQDSHPADTEGRESPFKGERIALKTVGICHQKVTSDLK